MWDELLAEVSSHTASSKLKPKNILILGEEGAGKTSLVCWDLYSMWHRMDFDCDKLFFANACEIVHYKYQVKLHVASSPWWRVCMNSTGATAARAETCSHRRQTPGHWIGIYVSGCKGWRIRGYRRKVIICCTLDFFISFYIVFSISDYDHSLLTVRKHGLQRFDCKRRNICCRMGCYILNGNTECATLMQLLLTNEAVRDTLIMLVVDLSRPWTIMDSLEK